MKNVPITLALVLALLLSSIAGAGTLPKTNELFGEFMPSPEFALNRAPALDSTENDVRTLVFEPFTDSDYFTFSKYLGAWGCECGGSSSDMDAVKAEIKKDGLKITFTYNRTNQIAAVEYPKGTRPETEYSAKENKKDILPSLKTMFGTMPSLSAVLFRLADGENTDSEGNRVVTFRGVTDTEFDEFSEYLDAFGCELIDYSVTGSIVEAKIAKHWAVFSIKYDTAAGDCVLTYPKGTNEENCKQIIEKWKIGKTVTFGVYPQTKSGTDKTPIEWIVLECDGDTALMISKYALDAEPYNETKTDVTWETCTLRAWLNNDFYNTAFSEEDRQQIVRSNVSADMNPEYDTDPGNATSDNVYLLNITEVKKYFANGILRRCAITDYAIENGAWTDSDYKTADGHLACYWWLRSPGDSSNSAAYVEPDGYVEYDGYYVKDRDNAVRPCIRVRFF